MEYLQFEKRHLFLDRLKEQLINETSAVSECLTNEKGSYFSYLFNKISADQGTFGIIKGTPNSLPRTVP